MVSKKKTAINWLSRLLILSYLLFGWAYLGNANADNRAGQASILDLRISETRDRTRLVFDLDSPARHTLFTLSKPNRVVIDLETVHLGTQLPKSVKNVDLLSGIRSALKDNNDLRIVLDLKHRARPRSFFLNPEGEYGHRLVIDLHDGRIQGRKPVKTIPTNKKLRDVIIAIDAGHGGKDPGAIGYRGIQEKGITLNVAKKLQALINKEQGIKAVMIRDGDYYLPLRERINKANRYKADLFISIHADSFTDKRANGSSVFALSLNGASSEAAKLLADRENAADLFGSVSLKDKDDLLASVLLDLAQTATIQSGLDLGSEILGGMGRVNKLHKAHVQQAGFLVLKSPDIPSVLVELAFLSNPNEAKKLSANHFQGKVATAILKGLKSYLSRKAPPGTFLAQRNQNQKRLASLPE